MTSDPAQQDQLFRARSLSPQSPIPIHTPTLRNIRVLGDHVDTAFDPTNMSSPKAASPRAVPPTASSEGQDEVSAFHEDSPLDDEHTDSFIKQKHRTKNAPPSVQGEKLKTIWNPQVRESFTSNSPHNPISPNEQSINAPAAHLPITLSSKNVSSLHVAGSPLSDGVPEHISQKRRSPIDVAIEEPGEFPADPAETIIAPQIEPATNVESKKVDYQALLDNIVSSSFVRPNSDDAISGISQSLSPSRLQAPIASLPLPPGLPARPPPQEKPAIHPNYDPDQDIQSYHKQSQLNMAIIPTSEGLQSTPYHIAQGHSSQSPAVAPGVASVPVTKSQHSSAPPIQHPPLNLPPVQRDDSGRLARRQDYSSDNVAPRVPEIEREYAQFLRAEADFTSQGLWERFPHGSRLFVGNLFTEKVDKRDVFYIFHKYGDLAQISLKSAYGFVQFINVHDCRDAIQSEQGLHIRGRKINLEVSKPQKNTRNAAAALAAGESLRAAYNRRSRSPDHGHVRKSSSRSNRHGYDSGSAQVQHARSEEGHRQRRSLSPRRAHLDMGFRMGSDRALDRYIRDRRSQSPQGRYSSYQDYGPPPTNEPDDESSLALPRRHPGSAPDVQLILVEEIDRTFVSYVQHSFYDRGLRCDVLQLPRVSITAVVKRQILEGVQAVVKIFRRAQITGKIPLQVFNRNRGLNDVQFDEYDDLDANIAAEIVTKAKSTHMAPPHVHQDYQSGLAQRVGPYIREPFTPAVMTEPNHQVLSGQQRNGAQPPILSNLISSLDGHSLQNLLASMSNHAQPSLANQASLGQGQMQNLSTLLSGVAQPDASQGSLQLAYAPPNDQRPPHEGSAHLAIANGSLPAPAFGSNGSIDAPSYGTQHQNVQDVMAQLAKYRR